MRRNGDNRLQVGFGLIIMIVLIGTIWYWLVEGFTPLEALFQTVITVSTVGFSEVKPLDVSGRVFTIVLILVGVGTALFILTSLVEEFVGGRAIQMRRRRVERRVAKLNGHMVVCGYGRIGATVCKLAGRELEVLVIERDEEACDKARDDGFIAVRGDATDDEILDQAGLDRAETLIAGLPTDADNLYIVLSARTANADLHIVARAQAKMGVAKLIKAGADRVVNPEDIGARRMAAFAMRPAVSEFLDVVMHDEHLEYRLEEVPVSRDSPIAGKTLAEAHLRDRTGATLLALRAPDGSFLTNPTSQTVLDAKSTLIAIGTDEQLHALADYI